jgi:hypothetical protein
VCSFSVGCFSPHQATELISEAAASEFRPALVDVPGDSEAMSRLQKATQGKP